MRSEGIRSNVTAAEMQRIVAAMRENLPPPEEIKPRPATATVCRHAEDTGVLAFVNLPCRGNRVECRKTGILSYAAACRPDKCKFHEEG